MDVIGSLTLTKFHVHLRTTTAKKINDTEDERKINKNVKSQIICDPSRCNFLLRPSSFEAVTSDIGLAKYHCLII